MNRLLAALSLAILLALPFAGCAPSSASLPPFTGASATVVAVGLQFQPTEVTLPAGQPLRLILDNQDSGVPHNLKVFQGDTLIARSPNVSGIGQTEVRFGPLAAGTYQFSCEVHPSMLGSIKVGP